MVITYIDVYIWWCNNTQESYIKKKKIMNYLRICYLVLLSFLISSSIFAEETKVSNDNTKFNIYSGMFDFSDNGKRSTLIGFQHQNTDLNRDTFLGNLSPITGFMIAQLICILVCRLNIP